MIVHESAHDRRRWRKGTILDHFEYESSDDSIPDTCDADGNEGAGIAGTRVHAGIGGIPQSQRDKNEKRSHRPDMRDCSPPPPLDIPEEEDLNVCYVLRCIRHIRRMCGLVVNDGKFQCLIIMLIIINAIMMGMGTFDFVLENESIDTAFETTDKIFLYIFTCELVLQFIYHGFNLFLNAWLVFDFTIIVMSYLFASMQVIRAFRVFRVIRLVGKVGSLRELVSALASTGPRMTAIMFILFLIFYIFAVMFTELFRDFYEQKHTDEDYFSRLDISLFTLFQMMTMDWAGVARQCMVVNSWAWLPFVTFVMISGFIVFNLIVGVICDATGTVGNEKEEGSEKDIIARLSISTSNQEQMDDITETLNFTVSNQERLQLSLRNLAQQLHNRRFITNLSLSKLDNEL